MSSSPFWCIPTFNNQNTIVITSFLSSLQPNNTITTTNHPCVGISPHQTAPPHTLSHAPLTQAVIHARQPFPHPSPHAHTPPLAQHWSHITPQNPPTSRNHPPPRYFWARPPWPATTTIFPSSTKSAPKQIWVRCSNLGWDAGVEPPQPQQDEEEK